MDARGAMDRETTERLLRAVGDLLDARGERHQVLVVGGVALAFGNVVTRTTQDVDVIALSDPGRRTISSAVPLPPVLQQAVATVARDFDLAPDWMNSVIGCQLDLGAPPGLLEEADWRTWGGLDVGFAGRRALVALKLYAAADQGPRSKHVHDLVALSPSEAEWNEARAWVRDQDHSPEFHRIVDQVVDHVRGHHGDHRTD
ncbi:hypothetical protein Pla163_29750 [Planctomycetes bacterium Pla163]|uniref:DUF6036 domain-containing protein n=1 Tax=Rohdeia mirabilis TaxID=2528008 RepID=A0A518D307_9BACT|nr:hypothetical protein Pla163_29750 [Planctomycetes bacterium Pla163]